MVTLAEGGQIEIHGRGIRGSIDAGDKPAFPGAPREHGPVTGVANEAFRFVPARGRVAKNLLNL